MRKLYGQTSKAKGGSSPKDDRNKNAGPQEQAFKTKSKEKALASARDN